MKIDSIGPYRVLRALDRRTDSRVFLAARPGGAQLVLEIAPLAEITDAGQREEARRRFRDAATRLSAVEHPGLARLVEFGDEEHALWWATEWVEGLPLAAHVGDDEALTTEDAVEAVALAADALGAAHDAGVTHGAIRPSRLLRAGPHGIKVVGFRPGDPGGDPLKRAAGSVGYLSPEQVRGKPIDARSDLFSLAVVLFELVTGGSPFPGESDSSTLYRIVHEDPVAPSAGPRPVGAELEAFLLRALARDPDARFPSAEIFAEALRRAAAAERVDAVFGGAERPAAEAPRGGPPRRAGAPARTSPVPFVVGAFVVLALVAAGAWWWHGGSAPAAPPPAVWLEADVRTEPPGLEVALDGVALDPPGHVRFEAQAPYPVLSARHECREVERVLDPADAGGEVVLVADPVELEWSFAPAVEGAEVVLDGKKVGSTPLDVTIDLCREHRLELRAAGYRPATVELAAGSSPLDARKQLYDLALQEIPKGRLRLPESDVQLVYYVDGRRLKKGERELTLEQGAHEVRYKNEYHWIDERQEVTIRGGAEQDLRLDGVALTTLVVQAYPANCKVYLRQGKESWRYLDETPAQRRIAPGRYQVKVVLNPTGEEQLREVELGLGDNPPLRVSFGGRG